MKKLINPFILLGLLCLWGTPALAWWSHHSPEPYIFPSSEVHRYYSGFVRDEYRLEVSLPETYNKNSHKRFPVIYVMDGQWYFTLISNINGGVAFDNQVSEAIVVGVTWAGDGADPNLLRVRDYTPTEVPGYPGSGGGAKFLAAMQFEILPFIQRHYRTNGRRVITGSSLGGLFALYAVIEKPELFDGCIALGATLGWDQNYIFERLAALPPQHFSKSTPCYLAFGEYDPGIGQYFQFLQAVSQLDLPNIDTKADVIEGTAHSSVNPIGFTYGLMHVLKRPRLSLNGELLDHYAGTYAPHDPDSPQFQVEVVNSELALVISGQDPLTLYAETPKHFYVEGAPIEVIFRWRPGEGFSIKVDISGTVYNGVKVD